MDREVRAQGWASRIEVGNEIESGVGCPLVKFLLCQGAVACVSSTGFQYPAMSQQALFVAAKATNPADFAPFLAQALKENARRRIVLPPGCARPGNLWR
jgi:hypothetical protein